MRPKQVIPHQGHILPREAKEDTLLGNKLEKTCSQVQASLISTLDELAMLRRFGRGQRESARKVPTKAGRVESGADLRLFSIECLAVEHNHSHRA